MAACTLARIRPGSPFGMAGPKLIRSSLEIAAEGAQEGDPQKRRVLIDELLKMRVNTRKPKSAYRSFLRI